MPLQCNIDSKGKLARLIYGIVFVLAGIVLAYFWAVPSGSLFRWIVSVGLILSGGFAIFEAYTGWCIVRAMGFKTPM